MKSGLMVVAAVAAAFAAGGALAHQKLKFAHVYETSEPYHTAAVWAAGEIAKRTSNRYAKEVFPASSPGKETDINQGLTLGTVDIIYTGQLFAGAPLWAKLTDADKKSFADVFREAAGRATAEIVDSEKKLVGEFEKRGKTVVRVDRKPFIAAVQKHYNEGKQPDGSAPPWSKDVYDKLQAIK